MAATLAGDYSFDQILPLADSDDAPGFRHWNRDHHEDTHSFPRLVVSEVNRGLSLSALLQDMTGP